MFLFIVSIITIVIYLWLKLKKGLHMLQQNWYNENNRYGKWLWKNQKKIFGNLDGLFVIFLVGLVTTTWVLSLIVIVIYFITTVHYRSTVKKEQVKKPLAITKRIKRLFFINYLVYAVPFVLYAFGIISSLVVLYMIVGTMIYLSFIVVYLANILDKPYIFLESKYYQVTRKKKLQSVKDLKVIGITGSYGKTSSKNILNDILSIKYNTLPTPKNFNTLNGLMITIQNHLTKFHEVFIAEMGAFRMGDIKQLAEFAQPKYGILTTIGVAHLESFGSRENIQKGKFELIESLPADGVAVLNGDDSYQTSYQLQNTCRVIWIGIENKEVDIYADNITLSHKGMKFDVHFKGDEKTYSFETKLLGKANIYNILAGIALGDEFGLSKEQLQAGVKAVQSIEHRLELKKYKDMYLIDDAYNSNPVGSKMALDVLALMPGKRIIITPGMIDLGAEQEALNKQFGGYIASAADAVILVGKEQTKPIYEGLMEEKYKKENIHILNDVKEAFTLIESLKEGETYVLIENDLPDLFNE